MKEHLEGVIEMHGGGGLLISSSPVLKDTYHGEKIGLSTLEGGKRTKALPTWY